MNYKIWDLYALNDDDYANQKNPLEGFEVFFFKNGFEFHESRFYDENYWLATTEELIGIDNSKASVTVLREVIINSEGESNGKKIHIFHYPEFLKQCFYKEKFKTINCIENYVLGSSSSPETAKTFLLKVLSDLFNLKERVQTSPIFQKYPFINDFFFKLCRTIVKERFSEFFTEEKRKEIRNRWTQNSLISQNKNEIYFGFKKDESLIKEIYQMQLNDTLIFDKSKTSEEDLITILSQKISKPSNIEIHFNIQTGAVHHFLKQLSRFCENLNFKTIEESECFYTRTTANRKGKILKVKNLNQNRSISNRIKDELKKKIEKIYLENVVM